MKGVGRRVLAVVKRALLLPEDQPSGPLSARVVPSRRQELAIIPRRRQEAGEHGKCGACSLLSPAHMGRGAHGEGGTPSTPPGLFSPPHLGFALAASKRDTPNEGGKSCSAQVLSNVEALHSLMTHPKLTESHACPS